MPSQDRETGPWTGRSLGRRGFAKELGEASTMTTDGREAGHARMRRGYLVVMVVALLALTVGIVGGTGEAEPEPREERPISLREVSPEVVARSYLSSLKLRQLDSAYLLLSDELRAGTTAQKYEVAVSLWLDEGENAWGLKYREVGKCSIEGDTAELQVVETMDGSTEPIWNWQLIRTADGWRISGLEGGPGIGQESPRK